MVHKANSRIVKKNPHPKLFVKAHILCNDIHTSTRTHVMQNKYVHCFKKRYISELKMCPNSKISKRDVINNNVQILFSDIDSYLTQLF